MNERSIFVEALERDDPLERSAYLDGACNGDRDLRTRIEKLLCSYANAESFLETPPDALIATIVGGDFDSRDEISLDFLEPSKKRGCLGTIAQYEVVDVVGRGGMGIVLRAYDTKLNRIVAIKALASELATNATAVKRFLREAQAAAAVSHDHVVTIHAIHDDSSPPYIVMEFNEGPSLQEKLGRVGHLELKEILRIGMQTAAGLAAAHEQGLVHRDIKPANILLENGVDRVKITDFGLARAVDDVSVTQPGLISGTPEYMSPEQARGDTVDHRSDLFSLGSVLYTMCTGRPPFRADTSIAMLRAVSEDTPAAVRAVNPEIPDWLDEIVAHLMEKDPARRIDSARAVSETLGSWLSHVQNPQVHKPPIRRPLAESSTSALAGATASLARRLPFALLLAVYLLCIAGFTAAIAAEVEVVLGAGPVCSLLGLAVSTVGWKRRSVPAVLLGLSTVVLSVLITAVIVVFSIGPSAAQDPVSWIVFLYALLAIPAGFVVLVTTSVEKPKEGWGRLLRFNLSTLLGVMLVAAITFAIVGIVWPHSGDDSPAALGIGLFFATTLFLGWLIVHICRRSTVLDTRPSPSKAAQMITRHPGWTIGVLTVAGLALILGVSLLYWVYSTTNYGTVVFRSPVSDLEIERISNGRVERTYDTLHGGGTSWHVPAGRWEFRIRGGRTDYRLSRTTVIVRRGSHTTITILPVEAPRDSTVPQIVVDEENVAASQQSKVWDKLIRLAEEELAKARTRREAGLYPIVDVFRAEAGVIEAKIQRARSLGRQQEVLSLLRELIQVREKELESIQVLHRGGKASQADLQATIKSLIEAQADLDEESAKNGTSQLPGNVFEEATSSS